MPVSVGSLLPQFGPVVGAGISINGVDFDDVTHPGPTTLDYKPPTLVGHACSGRPFWQGPPALELTWKVSEIDTFQALCVIFFSELNAPDGPLVTVTWPDPQEAGRYVQAQGYLEWPESSYEELYLRGVKVRISSFRQVGSGYF